MDKPILCVLGEYCNQIQWEDVSSSTVKMAKQCLMDLIECIYDVELDEERVLAGYQSILRYSGSGSVRVWRHDICVNGPDAAFYNALMGSVSYRNDIDRKSGTHQGAIAVSSAIADAEEFNADGKHVLMGIICGYEIGIRLGEFWMNQKMNPAFRNTAHSASLSAAFTVAKTLNLDLIKTISAASFSCNSLCGHNQWAVEGTGEDAFQAGWGARDGYQAAMLALAGAKGCQGSLDGNSGMMACYGCEKNARDMVAGLGVEPPRIERVQFKDVGACLMVQAPTQLAARISKNASINIYDIHQIIIYVAGQAKRQPGCDNREVGNMVQAKMNIRFGVAAAIVKKSAGHINWNAPYERDVLDLMNKCILVPKEEYTMLFPNATPVAIKIIFNDGTEIFDVQEDMKPLSLEQDRERFLLTLNSRMDNGQSNGILQMIDDFENIKNIHEFTRAFI